MEEKDKKELTKIAGEAIHYLSNLSRYELSVGPNKVFSSDLEWVKNTFECAGFCIKDALEILERIKSNEIAKID